MPAEPVKQADMAEENNMKQTILLQIDASGSMLYAELADTRAALALKEKLEQGSITIDVSDYEHWEKVGSLPWSLPTDDVQTKAVPGDIMLFMGKSFVIFYGNNDWAYTRLGRVIDKTDEEIQKILGQDLTQLTLSLTEK